MILRSSQTAILSLLIVFSVFCADARTDCMQIVQVTGIVTDARTCMPIEGAQVCLQDFCSPPCMLEPWLCGLCDVTDSLGRYHISRTCSIPTGSYFAGYFQIDIHEAGYLPDQLIWQVLIYAPCSDASSLFIPIDFGSRNLQLSADVGDLNGDSVIDVIDVGLLITHAFRGGSPPQPSHMADLNCDGRSNVADVVEIINIAFRGGQPIAAHCPNCGL